MKIKVTLNNSAGMLDCRVVETNDEEADRGFRSNNDEIIREAVLDITLCGLDIGDTIKIEEVE